MARTTAACALAVAAATLPTAQIDTPRPGAVFGFEPCADYSLATYEQALAYFRALAAARPDRIRLEEIGHSSQGRPQVMAIISSEENLANLDALKAISKRLALAQESDRDGGSENPLLPDANARQLAARGKAVVWIDFGLHASEVATAQAAPSLAYNVVTGESDEMRAIRHQVVFLLVPNLNPDGTTLVAEWYRAHQGQRWESRLPELWHPYVGHDNNRDWFMMTQRETRNASRQLYEEWFPQIVYDQHQAGPYPSRIFVPPFDEPVNPNIPPLVVRGINLVGDAVTRRLDREGKRGAVSRIGFDAWWNGGMRTVPYFHNAIGILTETAHPSATPTFNDPQSFPSTFQNGVSTSQPSAFYPSPYQGGAWHLRDSCEYILSASLAVLDIAASRREEWLYDRYAMARDAIAAHTHETFIVPAAQWDPGAAAHMVDVLRLGGVEVRQATAPFRAADRSYDTGSYIIPGAQAFHAYVKDLLTPQVYPDLRMFPNGPPRRPYDITGWTLSYQMGVDVQRVTAPVRVPTRPVDAGRARPSNLPSIVPEVYVLDPRANDAFLAVNRLLASGARVYRAPSPLEAGTRSWPAGAFLIPRDADAPLRVARATRDLGLTVGGVAALPADARRMARPRVGLYHAWGGNLDEGWTRWLLERFEFDARRLLDSDVRQGALGQRYDAIVLPDATWEQMRDGLAPGTMPERYTGGLTDRGLAALREFVSGGGTLIAMDSAVELPIRLFDLPVRDVAANVRDSELFIPGTLLRIAVDPTQPVAYGMPGEAAAVFVHSASLEITPTRAARSIRTPVTYAARDLRLSGWALGERLIAGRAAVLDVEVDRGRVVLLGFRTQHRAQPHGTFKLLFNSLLLSSLEG